MSTVIAYPGTEPDPNDDIWRMTVDQYHEMVQQGILTADDPVELLHFYHNDGPIDAVRC